MQANKQELVERERFLGAILRAIPDFVFVYDFDRRESVFANGDIGAYLGYSKEQISEAGDQLFSYVVHPDDVLSSKQILDLRHKHDGEEAYERTIRLQDSEGQWRHFSFCGAGLERTNNGEVKYSVVVARDITHVLKTEQSLNDKELRLRLLEDNFSDIVLCTNQELELDYVSPSIYSLLGYKPQDLLALENQQRFAVIGLAQHLEALAGDYCHALTQCKKLAYEGEGYQSIFLSEALHSDGTRIPVEIKVTLLIGQQHQELQGLLIVCRDIRERARIEADLRLAAKVFENSQEGIYITNKQGRITQVNQAFSDITGYSAEQSLEQRPAFLGSGWHEDYFSREIQPVLDRSGYWQGEVINRRASGSVFPALVGITAVLSDATSEAAPSAENLLGYITTFRDITEFKDNEQQIRKLAYYDALTDLPNRSLFLDRLSQEVQRAQRNHNHVALLFLDLDRFKVINDSMGHAVGDRLLTEVARRLKESIRADDTVARMGGDEFTIILNDLNSREDAESAATQVSQKALRALNESFVLQGRDVYISASIGIAVYPQDGDSNQELLKNADTAMYHIKEAGKNGYQFYTESMNARALERLELQNSLHRAVLENEFELNYLSIQSLQDKTTQGFEALLRWRHPEKGILEPEQFLAVAEECGLSVKIGAWVINQACGQMAAWQQQGISIERVAVNISRLHFSDGNLIEHVIDALDESGIYPHQLELEFQEALLMDDIGYTKAMLQDLKALGVRLSVDDYGTGFSSLHHLQQLPVNSLKIDRRFIENMPKSVDDTRLARAIISLAQSFGFSVIAEGVESELQVEYLASLGCQEAQGYYFGRPVPAEKISKLFAGK